VSLGQWEVDLSAENTQRTTWKTQDAHANLTTGMLSDSQKLVFTDVVKVHA
jgi:hypothetical protein